MQHLAVARVEVNAQRLRAAAHIADAHRARVGVAAHLAEGLHLHGADERNERVGSRAALLRQKADKEQQHDLRQKNELPPVYPLHVLEMPMNTLSHENTQHEREHRHKIASAVRPVTIEKIGAEEHDVARLRVGKHLAAAEIGIGVLQAAGENDERRRQHGFRHLPARPVRKLSHPQVLHLLLQSPIIHADLSYVNHYVSSANSTCRK